jgi:Txe/YoeB family toxin of Txe-Axe toxin-antitoxin module
MGNTFNLPVVLNVSKTWSFRIRKEHRLRMFEVTVQKKVLGTKIDEGTRLRQRK